MINKNRHSSNSETYDFSVNKEIKLERLIFAILKTVQIEMN